MDASSMIAGGPRRRTSGRTVTAGLAVAAVVLLGACRADPDDGDGTVSPSPTPTQTSAAPTTAGSPSGTPGTTATASPSATPSSGAPAASLPAEEAATVVYPAPGASEYGDPEAAASGFASDYAGFENPTLSDFMQGDSRSGEFEVTPADGRLVTTVLVRQLSDDAWYVIGSSTRDIQVDEPVAGARSASPLGVSGNALAFEGNVLVQVRGPDGTVLGQAPVTGSGGPDPGPFAGEIPFTDPGSGHGAALFLTHSARDGSLEQVVAVPVAFDG
ncbi:Gmad2 immunoglobulin-like domain-containing protein [Zhihengliuella sp.]|uniref:Gmad2 immunoglobulin-like domain-containing protein n=1 Tax=Zhihengliuella sp. TaxID=1954483 RepID=UPI002811D92E|nr:Gmad2 immunoglobulin-like domain-containing protein [Zhihengliuella sp.]